MLVKDTDSRGDSGCSSSGGIYGCGGGRGTLRPAADDTWQPKWITAVSGPDSYALLFLLVKLITFYEHIVASVLPLWWIKINMNI